ncbi:MAG: GNAT family N-acetyltransferase [Flammeovirgaceae bacterium]
MNIIFTSERLIVRQFTTEDYEQVYELNSDAEIMRYIFSGQPHSRAEARVYLDKILAFYPKNAQFGVWALELKASKDFVGLACLRPYEATNEMELGYRLAKKYWGKGLATEVSTAILHYGFQTLNLPHIMAVVVKENQASRNVLEKIGMTHKGAGFYYESELEYYEIDNPHLLAQ